MSDELWGAIQKRHQKITPGSMVQDMYGQNARGGPNTKAAAQDLGVSQRTVQRWIKTGHVPAKPGGGGEKLQQGHDRWAKSPDGRRAKLSTRREARLRNQGTSMVFFGTIQISGDTRNRGITVDLTGPQMSRILDAALAGDDVAAHKALEDAFGQAMGGSVRLRIEHIETYR